MKFSTKLFASAVAALALFFTTNADAQNSRKFGLGVNLGIPTSEFYSFAIGADARLQFDVSKQVSIPLVTGYTHLIGKDLDNNVKVSDFGYIPLKTGLKVFFDESGSGLYGLGEIGAAFGVTKNAGTSFLYAPTLGYSFSSGLDLGIKYEGLSKGSGDQNQVALRIAYGFKL